MSMSSGELDESFTKKNDDRDLYKQMPWLALTNNFYKKSPAHDSIDESDDDDDGAFGAHQRFLNNPTSNHQFGGGNFMRPESEELFETQVGKKPIHKPLIVEENDDDSDFEAGKKPPGNMPEEDPNAAPVYRRPQGVGETVHEPGGRSWKRDEIWKQVKAANAGQNLAKAPAKDKRGFGDHMKSLGKGLGSFASWAGLGLFTGIGAGISKFQGWREKRNFQSLQSQYSAAQAKGADALELKGIERSLANSSNNYERHAMKAHSRGRHASGYQWRKRLGWLTKNEQADIQQASGFGMNSGIKATWRDARDQVQGRVPVENHANSVTSGELADRPETLSPADIEKLEDQRDALKEMKPKSLAEQRQKMRQTRVLDAKIRDSSRRSSKQLNFAAMNFGEVENAPQMEAIAEQDEDDDD